MTRIFESRQQCRILTQAKSTLGVILCAEFESRRTDWKSIQSDITRA